MFKNILAQLFGRTHVVTVAQIIRDGEQITIQAFVKTADEYQEHLQKAEAAIANRKKQFSDELKAVQAEIQKEAKAKKATEGSK